MKRGCIIIIVLVAFAFGYLFYNYFSSPGIYDDFASCITVAGAKMYGTYICKACDMQINNFGDSWKFVNYEECLTSDGRSQTKECKSAGIRVYPTWEFADGSRAEGVLPFNILSLKTGCPLPD